MLHIYLQMTVLPYFRRRIRDNWQRKIYSQAIMVRNPRDYESAVLQKLATELFYATSEAFNAQIKSSNSSV